MPCFASRTSTSSERARVARIFDWVLTLPCIQPRSIENGAPQHGLGDEVQPRDQPEDRREEAAFAAEVARQVRVERKGVRQADDGGSRQSRARQQVGPRKPATRCKRVEESEKVGQRHPDGRWAEPTWYRPQPDGEVDGKRQIYRDEERQWHPESAQPLLDEGPV